MVKAASRSECVDLTCDEAEAHLAKKFTLLILLDDQFLCF
jgi:hypothetical protein